MNACVPGCTPVETERVIPPILFSPLPFLPNTIVNMLGYDKRVYFFINDIFIPLETTKILFFILPIVPPLRLKPT